MATIRALQKAQEYDTALSTTADTTMATKPTTATAANPAAALTPFPSSDPPTTPSLDPDPDLQRGRKRLRAFSDLTATSSLFTKSTPNAATTAVAQLNNPQTPGSADSSTFRGRRRHRSTSALSRVLPLTRSGSVSRRSYSPSAGSRDSQRSQRDAAGTVTPSLALPGRVLKAMGWELGARRRSQSLSRSRSVVGIRRGRGKGKGKVVLAGGGRRRRRTRTRSREHGVGVGVGDGSGDVVVM